VGVWEGRRGRGWGRSVGFKVDGKRAEAGMERGAARRRLDRDGGGRRGCRTAVGADGSLGVAETSGAPVTPSSELHSHGSCIAWGSRGPQEQNRGQHADGSTAGPPDREPRPPISTIERPATWGRADLGSPAPRNALGETGGSAVGSTNIDRSFSSPSRPWRRSWGRRPSSLLLAVKTVDAAGGGV